MARQRARAADRGRVMPDPSLPTPAEVAEARRPMTDHIGFTGTRKGWTVHQWDQTSIVLDVLAGTDLDHGDCIGSDASAHVLAQNKGYRIHLRPGAGPGWLRAFCRVVDGDICYAAKPYLERNRDIVDASTVLIATPGEMTEQLRSGTWSTIRYARKRGRRVIIIFPDGSVWDSAEGGDAP